MVILVLVAVVAVTLVVLSCARYDTWRRKGVPYVRPWPLVGNCLATLLERENLFQTFHRVCQQFPGAPFVGVYAGPSAVLLVKDLEAVRDITVKDFHVFTNHALAPDRDVDETFGRFVFCLKDDEWKNTRVKMTPAFSSGRLKAMYPGIRSLGGQLVQSIRDSRDSDGAAPLGSLATRYGIDVIGSTAFGIEAGAMKDPANSPYMKAIAEAFKFGSLQGLSAFMLMFAPRLYRLFRIPLMPAWRMGLISTLLKDAAKHREALLQEQPSASKDIFDTLLSIRRNGELPPELFEAQVMAMQVGGSESSAKAIMFSLWEMARRPECQDKLRAELQDAVSKEQGEQLSYETLHGLPYLDAVFKETLRKWPILPWLDRRCAQDYTIPGTSLSLAKGAVVFVPVFSIMRDPQLFEDPDAFRPERFEDKPDQATRLAPLWFGSGPRQCIGSRFGEMGVKTALSEIILNFRVSLAESTPREESELPISPTAFLITLDRELELRCEEL